MNLLMRKKMSKAIKEKTLTVMILWNLYENSIYVGNNDKNKNSWILDF